MSTAGRRFVKHAAGGPKPWHAPDSGRSAPMPLLGGSCSRFHRDAGQAKARGMQPTLRVPRMFFAAQPPNAVMATLQICTLQEIVALVGSGSSAMVDPDW